MAEPQVSPAPKPHINKVLSSELGEYIERVVRNFVKQREDGERFAQWAVRADEADLR